MIQGIQNVSFAGVGAKVAKSVMKNAEEAYVSASSNLEGTVNATKAERLLRNAQFAQDKDTLAGRVASLLASKKNISTEELNKSLARVEAEKATKEVETKVEVPEFSFFG